MRRLGLLLLLCCGLLPAGSAAAADGRVIKVLPHFLDIQGRHTLDPSLYERDAYQAFLRRNPDRVSGIRFDVQWKAQGPVMEGLRLRVELRGTASDDLPTATVLEAPVHPRRFSRWTSLPLAGEEYARFGRVTAWRATLWDGDTLLGEQKSFLW